MAILQRIARPCVRPNRKHLMSLIRATTLAMAIALGQNAFAEGLYTGIGVVATGAASQVDQDGSGAESRALYGGLGGTVGYAWGREIGLLAAEVDADLNFNTDFESDGQLCSESVSAPYYCSHANTVRLRGIFGKPFGDRTIFGSAGLMIMVGEIATAPEDLTLALSAGFTLGAGFTHPFRGNRLRYEIIYDRATTALTTPDGTNPAFAGVAFKTSYLFD